jgi:hypothetical protein
MLSEKKPVPPGLERYPHARVNAALGVIGTIKQISRKAFAPIDHHEALKTFGPIGEEATGYMHSLDPLVDYPQLFGTRYHAARGLESLIHQANSRDEFFAHDRLLTLITHPLSPSMHIAVTSLRETEKRATGNEETPITNRVIYTALQAALFELHRQNIHFKINPYTHLLKLYALGAINAQLRPVFNETVQTDEERLVVDVPFLHKNGGYQLACQTFGDKEEQLGDVIHAHGLYDDCRHRQPLHIHTLIT